MDLSELALTVIQLEADEYHWVLMEATEAASDDVLCFAPVDSSTKPYRHYADALTAGAVALRQKQGIAYRPVIDVVAAMDVDECSQAMPAQPA